MELEFKIPSLNAKAIFLFMLIRSVSSSPWLAVDKSRYIFE